MMLYLLYCNKGGLEVQTGIRVSFYRILVHNGTCPLAHLFPFFVVLTLAFLMLQQESHFETTSLKLNKTQFFL